MAERAEVHLALNNGTNLALMNALVHELIARGYVDRGYVDAHTVGFERLAEITAEATPERAAGICGVDADDIRRAAEILGTSDRVVSTCSMGFYQSHQATAASCQVNNIHLLRGMLGRPGAGILQMNGQPSAQNNRETGCGPALPGFRNWDNPRHVEQLAQLWNVDPMVIPHWSPPPTECRCSATPRRARSGSCGSPAPTRRCPCRTWPGCGASWPATNVSWWSPTATAPRRPSWPTWCCRRRCGPKRPAPTPTPTAPCTCRSRRSTRPARLARIWPSSSTTPAGWACPTGTGRRCLPGRRPGKPSRRGRRPAPAGRVTTPGSATPSCTRPAASNGRAPPARRKGPNEATATGFPVRPRHLRDLRARPGHRRPGRRVRLPGPSPRRPGPAQGHRLRAPFEEPDERYPFRLTTGRTVYHFHTRTKTARSRPLNQAAPAMWVEISEPDASRLGIAEGDIVRVTSRRGSIQAPARIAYLREGVVFAPWHYGGDAANDLTLGAWDPVSKQPEFKVAAVSVERVAAGTGPAPAPVTTASAPVHPLDDAAQAAPE